MHDWLFIYFAWNLTEKHILSQRLKVFHILVPVYLSKVTFFGDLFMCELKPRKDIHSVGLWLPVSMLFLFFLLKSFDFSPSFKAELRSNRCTFPPSSLKQEGTLCLRDLSDLYHFHCHVKVCFIFSFCSWVLKSNRAALESWYSLTSHVMLGKLL